MLHKNAQAEKYRVPLKTRLIKEKSESILSHYEVD
jgi:hypothetical protein